MPKENPQKQLSKQAQQQFQKCLKLRQIKQSLTKVINDHKKGSNSLDSRYRTNTTNQYKNRIKTVFIPRQMENYKSIKNFEKNFDSYIKQDKATLQIMEHNNPYTQDTVKQMSKRGLHDVLLTLNIDQLCELSCSMDHKFRKQVERGNCISKISEEERRRKNYDKQFNLLKDTTMKVKKCVQFLPQIVCKNSSTSKDKKLNKQQQLQQQLQQQYNGYCEKNLPINYSPSFRSMKRTSTNPNPTTTEQTINQMKKNHRLKKQVSSLFYENFFPDQLIDKLNVYNQSFSTLTNFRMTLNTFKQMLKERFGNQIISSYFQLPKLLDIENICQVLNTISNSSHKEKLMVAFLTFDVNCDGFVCEKDLFYISQKVSSNAIINQDIYKILQYMQRIRTANRCIFIDSQYREPKIPKQLVQNPKRSIYIKLFERQSALQISRDEKSLQKKRDTLVDRHYNLSTKILNSTRNKLNYQNNFQNNQRQQNKIIKVNFEVFQQIFMLDGCRMMNDLTNFLLKKEDDEDDIMQFNLSSKISRKNSIFVVGNNNSQNNQNINQTQKKQLTGSQSTLHSQSLQLRHSKRNNQIIFYGEKDNDLLKMRMRKLTKILNSDQTQRFYSESAESSVVVQTGKDKNAQNNLNRSRLKSLGSSKRSTSRSVNLIELEKIVRNFKEDDVKLSTAHDLLNQKRFNKKIS